MILSLSVKMLIENKSLDQNIIAFKKNQNEDDAYWFPWNQRRYSRYDIFYRIFIYRSHDLRNVYGRESFE